MKCLESVQRELVSPERGHFNVVCLFFKAVAKIIINPRVSRATLTTRNITLSIRRILTEECSKIRVWSRVHDRFSTKKNFLHVTQFSDKSFTSC